MREKCREFVLAHCAGFDASHDISHVDRVVQNALRILEESPQDVRDRVNPDILVAIASLHDCFDHKYFTNSQQVNRAKAKVEQFLISDCHVTEKEAIMIVTVIDSMGFTAEMKNDKQVSESLFDYMHIVQDADRLDAIGAVGIARCFAFCGAFNRPFLSPSKQDELQKRLAYERGYLEPDIRKDGSGIRIFYDKLLFLKDKLKTGPGRKLGQERHAFMLSFLNHFYLEVGM
jgi:uncharacterized protein